MMTITNDAYHRIMISLFQSYFKNDTYDADGRNIWALAEGTHHRKDPNFLFNVQSEGLGCVLSI